MSMDGKYQIRYDGEGFRWEWLNIPCARFPYTVWRGPEYPRGSLVSNAPTLRWAHRLIRKDRARLLRAGGGEKTIWREPVDPSELPDLRTVPEASR